MHLGNFVIQLKSSTREVHLSATTEQERAAWVNVIRSLQTDQDNSRQTASGSHTALLRNMSESLLHASAIPVLMAHNRRSGRPNRFSKERKEERKRQRLPKMKKSFSELWIEDIIPQSGRHDPNIVEALCFAGIPKEVRGRAWAWILGNKLQVNEDLFKICKARALAVRREMTLKREAETRSRLQAAERTTSATSLASSSSSSPATTNSSNASDLPFQTVAEDSDGDAKLKQSNDDAEKSQFAADETQSMMLQEAVSIAEMLVAHGERSIRLVNVDMPRTFGHHPLFQAGADGTERTTEVLEAYICYRPDLGYVQGMSYLAAALCFHMDSFTAFKAMVSLMSTSLLFDMFRLEEKRVSLAVSCVCYKRLFVIPNATCCFVVDCDADFSLLGGLQPDHRVRAAAATCSFPGLGYRSSDVRGRLVRELPGCLHQAKQEVFRVLIRCRYCCYQGIDALYTKPAVELGAAHLGLLCLSRNTVFLPGQRWCVLWCSV